ncbi:MAG: polymer-forming cytoskeletal protein [Verrucomicrobiota bacterium]|nr:polymer-forming cytoskeletal protein [Verrucomicrobiota bacterium]
MIDGFTSVQMVRRAAKRNRNGAPVPRDDAEATPAAEPFAGKIGAKVTQTALPDRYDIVCYECGYAFVLTGHLRRTICPKCRAQLEAGATVAAKEYSGAARTIGTVHVKPAGVLKDAVVTARILIVEGDATGGTLRCQQLQIGKGGRLALDRTTFRDLLIAGTAEFKPDAPVKCRALEVKGTIDADILAERVIVRAGGLASGNLRAERLVVDDGGGLKATVCAGKKTETEPNGEKPRNERHDDKTRTGQGPRSHHQGNPGQHPGAARGGRDRTRPGPLRGSGSHRPDQEEHGPATAAV